MQQKSEYLNEWAGLVDPLLAKGIMDINYTRDGYKRKGVKHWKVAFEKFLHIDLDKVDFNQCKFNLELSSLPLLGRS